MNRRRVVFGAAAASLAPLAPRAAGSGRPAAQPRHDVLLVGVGRSGVAVIDSLEEHGVRGAERIALRARPEPATIPWEVVRAQDGPAIAHLVSESVDRLRAVPPITIVVGAMEGRTASLALGPLIEHLSPRSSVHVVALLPHVTYGWPWTSRARSTLRSIIESGAGFSLIEPDQPVRNQDFCPCCHQELDYHERLHRALVGAAVRGIGAPTSRVATCDLPGEPFGWPGRQETITVITGQSSRFTGLFLGVPDGYQACVEGLFLARVRSATLAEARTDLARVARQSLEAARRLYGLTPEQVARNLEAIGRAVPLP